jgi:hypothetical protein
MKRKSRPHVPEKEVVRIWQKRVRRQRFMNDAAGEPLEVIYPGRLNDNRGGDFRDAVIAAGSELQYGCIEIHSRSSGWRTHGHQADPFYNQVVLHVALEEDAAGKTVRQDGKVVPTIILNQNIPPGGGPERTGSPRPCQAARSKRRAAEIQQSLEEAGIRRFNLKAERYGQELSDPDEGQSLYLGIMEALGYNRNSRPFLDLGRRFSLPMAEKMIGVNIQGQALADLQAVLLGTAGLLPSQRGLHPGKETYIANLECVWERLSGAACMSRPDWELFRVRPGNSPVRRIIALSHLILRFQAKGLRQSLEDLVLRALSNPDLSVLESALTVEAGGYWADHYDFASPSKIKAGQALLGRARVRAIVVNALLPYLQSRVWTGRLSAAASGISELFCHYPRQESNSIERHMLKQLALDFGQVNSACLQQGLMHLYKQYCIQGKCGECLVASSGQL